MYTFIKIEQKNRFTLLVIKKYFPHYFLKYIYIIPLSGIFYLFIETY